MKTEEKIGCGEMFICKDEMGVICGNNYEELLCPKCKEKTKKDERRTKLKCKDG